MKELEGKFVIYNSGGAWRSGQVKIASGETLLVQFDQMTAPDPTWSLPAELVCLHQVMHEQDEDLKAWGFFDTREALEAYVKWMDTPSKPRVVQLVKGKHDGVH